MGACFLILFCVSDLPPQFGLKPGLHRQMGFSLRYRISFRFPDWLPASKLPTANLELPTNFTPANLPKSTNALPFPKGRGQFLAGLQQQVLNCYYRELLCIELYYGAVDGN